MENSLCWERHWLLTMGLRSWSFSLQGLSRDSAKRLRFVPGVVYVDGMCSHPWSIPSCSG